MVHAYIDLPHLQWKQVWSYMTQMLDFLWRLYDKEYGKDLYTLEDILEDSPTLHRILWIQRVKGIPFIWFLVCQCLIVVGDLYFTDYDEIVSSVCAHLRQGAMK